MISLLCRVQTSSFYGLKGACLGRIFVGERLRLALPGGGGFGDPKERDRQKVLRNVRDGLVSPEAAEKVYGVRMK